MLNIKTIIERYFKQYQLDYYFVEETSDFTENFAYILKPMIENSDLEVSLYIFISEGVFIDVDLNPVAVRSRGDTWITTSFFTNVMTAATFIKEELERIINEN